MKKQDIIQLVKETIKETTFYGNRHQRSSISGLPGVMEDENLEEITNYGQQGIYPKKEKPGDMFQQKEVEDLFPNAMASRSDKDLKDRLKKHADWTEQSGYNNTFVHFQYNETEGLEDEYFIYQSQHYNGNYDDFRNPKFTDLIIRKNRDTEKEENLGTYVVDTKAYVKDLQTLRSRGVLGKTVMENFEKGYGEKIDTDYFKNNPKLQKGKTVLYMGASQEILNNDGFVLTLKSKDGETSKVNLNQFIKKGAIKEKNMKNNVKEADTKTYVGTDAITAIKKDPRYGTLSGDTKMDIEKKLKGGGSVELEEYLNEEPNEGNAFAVARLKAIKAGDKKFKLGDKEFDVTNVSDDDKKAAAELDETMHTNDVGKDDYMDDEGRMAKSQIYKMGKYAVKLHGMLDDMEQLPAWVQSKITKASDYMSMVYHYLDYEFARRDGNLMEHVDKYNKRATLMEGAMKKFFKMFDEGMTDEEVVLDYAQKGTQVPEAFISKARKQYEGMKRMKLELEMSEKEYKNSASKMVSNAEEGMEPSMEEKKLASGLNN